MMIRIVSLVPGCIVQSAHFIEPTIDEDLRQIQKKYVLKGEKIFAGLDKELPEDVFATTYRRNNRESWELEFVSVIDTRGAKASRAYFTKWHELAHLLTLTDQLRLSFRKPHVAKNFNSPRRSVNGNHRRALWVL